MKDGQDIALLIEAFETSNQAALKLQDAYNSIEKKVEELSIELDNKNKELKKNLKEKERVKNFLNNILESLKDGVMAIDLEGKITMFNQSAEHITGYRWTDVAGKNYTDVLGIDFFKDFPQTRSLKDWVSQFNEEAEIRTKSRSLVPVGAVLTQLKSENQLIGILIIFRDLSVIKGLEAQVKRTNVLSAMGEMAANIAHEVRNPLASIQLFAEMLEDDLAKEPTKRELARHIVSAVKNLNSTVSNLLFFTKEFSPATYKTTVTSLVEESLIFTRHIIEQNSIQLKKNLGAKDLCVMAEPELLKQVFLNLFLNAVQAMDGGGVLSISAKAEEEDEELHGYTQISVQDNGKGIPQKDLEKIFSPFHTTRKEGTGLGLAIVRRIIEAHKGSITAKNIEGSGACFDIYLPSGRD